MKISVIMPVYNMAPLLPAALDSVLAQDLREYELLCIDDGSTDDSSAVLADYAARDGRIRVIRQENAGAGPARNRGIREAAGKYVFFLDPDDLLPDGGVLRDLRRAAEESGLPVSGGNAELIGRDGRRRLYEEGGIIGADGVVEYRDFPYLYGFWRFLWRTDFLREKGLFFPPLRRFQDPPFMLKALAESGSFAGLRRCVYLYRSSPAIRCDAGRAGDILEGMRQTRELCRGYELPRHEAELRRLFEEFSRRMFLPLLEERLPECGTWSAAFRKMAEEKGEDFAAFRERLLYRRRHFGPLTIEYKYLCGGNRKRILLGRLPLFERLRSAEMFRAGLPGLPLISRRREPAGR